MKRTDEVSDQKSCFNRALNEERIFVLLARDEAAAATVEFWARERIRLGKNILSDPEIQDALSCAALMRTERDGVRRLLGRKQ